MSDTPETDRIARLLENLDEWIDDSLRNSKPIGLTLCAARSTIADHRARIKEMWDALETLRRERDEARELLKKALVRGDLALAETKKAKENLFWSDHQDKREIQRERAEAREQVKELREALLRVRTWGVSSKNFSATDSYKMAEWIDDGCEGELPKPDGPWIYEKMEETK